MVVGGVINNLALLCGVVLSNVLCEANEVSERFTFTLIRKCMCSPLVALTIRNTVCELRLHFFLFFFGSKG